MKKNITSFATGIRKLQCTLLLLSISTFATAQGWVQKANFPGVARDAAVCFELNGNIYFGGGTNQSDFWEYTPATGTWVQKASIPNTLQERVASVGFAMNGKGYVGLGLDTNNKSDMWEYDPGNNSWTQKSDFPGGKREGAFCFVIGSKAYIGCGADSMFYLNSDVWEYDPAGDSWLQRADYPDTAIIYPFSFTIGSKGYLSCGQISTEIKKTFEFDPVSNTWAPKADFPGPARQAGTAFVVGGKGYCGFGVSDNFETYYNDFFAYDPVSNVWTTVGSIPGSSRAWPSAAVVSDIAYLGTGWAYTTASTYYKDWWTFSVPTAVGNVSAGNSKYSIYPNPATNTIHIATEGKDAVNYVLYNQSGQAVGNGSFVKEGQANIAGLPAGSYLLEVNTKSSVDRFSLSILNK